MRAMWKEIKAKMTSFRPNRTRIKPFKQKMFLHFNIKEFYKIQDTNTFKILHKLNPIDLWSINLPNLSWAVMKINSLKITTVKQMVNLRDFLHLRKCRINSDKKVKISALMQTKTVLKIRLITNLNAYKDKQFSKLLIKLRKSP
jgi:hypothetical protein